MIVCVGFIIYGVLLFILAGTHVMTWLQSMYGLALIKMVTMPMKYMPQVKQIKYGDKRYFNRTF